MPNSEISRLAIAAAELTLEAAESAAAKLFRSAQNSERAVHGGTIPALRGAEPTADLSARAARNQALETLYRDQPLHLNRYPREHANTGGLQTGYVVDSSDRAHHVFLRNMTDWRAADEVASYQMHSISPFTTHFPVTMLREDGKVIQERVGKSLQLRIATLDKREFGASSKWLYESDPPSFQRLVETNSQFRDQMEQVVAQRLVFGAPDMQEGNIAMTSINRRPLLANIDMQSAFATRSEPMAPMFRTFQGAEISPATMAKLDSFYKTIDSPEGRAFMKETGLNQERQTSMLWRTEWFLENGKFKSIPPILIKPAR